MCKGVVIYGKGMEIYLRYFNIFRKFCFLIIKNFKFLIKCFNCLYEFEKKRVKIVFLFGFILGCIFI